MKKTSITFPEFTGIRCLMMPYIQGVTDSIPREYAKYFDILDSLFFKKGDVGFLTIDESPVEQGKPHRGDRAKYGRALHTEAGRVPGLKCGWGHAWGGSHRVTLDDDVEIMLANNIDGSCALWDATHHDTSIDGDIGDKADQYPYDDAVIMDAGEVYQIGILTPHESLPVKKKANRQFLRIVSAGVHGREDYFTENPLLAV